jgi:hypothetical protein
MFRSRTLRRAASVATLVSANAALALSAAAQVAPTGGVDTGLETTAKAAFGGNLPAQRDLPTIIGTVIQQAIALVGVLFMALVVYGGFVWMTARGNEQQIEKAKNLLTSAVIGLVIIGAGYAITDFVLRAVTTATTGEQ